MPLDYVRDQLLDRERPPKSWVTNPNAVVASNRTVAPNRWTMDCPSLWNVASAIAFSVGGVRFVVANRDKSQRRLRSVLVIIIVVHGHLCAQAKRGFTATRTDTIQRVKEKGRIRDVIRVGVAQFRISFEPIPADKRRYLRLDLLQEVALCAPILVARFSGERVAIVEINIERIVGVGVRCDGRCCCLAQQPEAS
jgi:hypothetical protein